ncbi:MAG: hypothetical protein ACK5V3_09085 [Bdellovibrionales bacterium]
MKVFKKKPIEKLVAEQNGGRQFWMGIFISVFLGFVLRAYFSPQNIHNFLVKATASVGSDVQISWSNARLQLREGLLLPRLALEIENFQLVSIDPCAGEPILFSKKVEVPIQIFNWISNQKPIQSLNLMDSFLEFRTALQCRLDKIKEVPQPNASVQKAVRMRAKNEVQSRPPLVLREFNFEKIKIRHPKLPSDWTINQFGIEVIENQPWYVTLRAQFPIPETDSVDSLVQIYSTYKEFPTPRFDIDIKGHWREGHFTAKGNWNLDQKTWKLQSQFDHFPLQFLKIISLKAKTPWNWPDHPMWFTFSLDAEDKVQDLSQTQLLLRGVRIEGDLGELKVPDLRIIGLKPLKVEPFVFQADQIQLDKVFSKQFTSQAPVQSLGIMTGQGQWIAQNEFRFSGEFNDIKLKAPTWLSSQPLWKAKAEFLNANLKKGNWEISTQSLMIEGAPLDGRWLVTGDQDLKSGKLKAQIKLEKSPHKLIPVLDLLEVQNLDLNTFVQWDIGKKINWSLDYKLSRAFNNEVNLVESKGSIKSKNYGWDFKGQFQSGSIIRPTQLIRNWKFSDDTWPLDLGLSQFSINSKEGLHSWKWAGPKLNFEGQLKEDEQLEGTIKIKNQTFRYSRVQKEEPITLVPN